jgi:serine/threonine protein kinase
MPATPAGDGRREPTQSLHLEPGEQPSPAPLALGTHNRRVTRIESPGGRGKTPEPPASLRPIAMAHRNADAPEDYLDAVLGSYRVLELLGKGGMGYVFRAEHVKLGREVALKLLRGDYASRRDAVARFFQEARTVNRVRHRNIVEVTDFVELDDGTTYIIMELLTGASLGAWARDGIDLPRALAVLVQICDGLGAAHQVGVVHRDLKPDNVIVVPTSDGADLVKLLDFGVAKLLNREDEDVGFQTAAGSVIGTPAYMSPEQAGGMVIDARSDIYSLGAIMYELFCGEPIFRGRSFGEYVRKHLTELPVPPRQTAGGALISPELEAVILRSLEKDPAQRFSHIVELREALLTLLGGMGAQLPGALPLSGSGIHLQSTQLPGRLPVRQETGPLSQLPRMSQISGIAGLEGLSGVRPAPGRPHAAHGYAAAPTAGAAWWRWGLGGAMAVGLGVTAAVWYAGRGGSDLTPPPAPTLVLPALPAQHATAQPIDPPPAHAQAVELRFDSLPSGGVFAAGRSAELCRTPCAFNLDLSDGGPTDRRAFVIKREGYLDGAITVDLTGDKREFHVMLQQAAPAAQLPADRTPEAKDEGKPESKPEAKDEGKLDPRLDKRPGKRPIKTVKKDANLGKDASPGKDANPGKDTKPGTPAPTDAREPDRERPLDPPDGKQPPTKKPVPRPPIDPSDTLDPFHRK